MTEKVIGEYVEHGDEMPATENVVADLDVRDDVVVASVGTTDSIHIGGSRPGLNSGVGTEPVSGGSMNGGTGTQPFTAGAIPDDTRLDDIRAQMREEQAESSASYKSFCLGPGAQPRGNIVGLDAVQRINDADEQARRDRRAAAAKLSNR